MAIIKCKMCGGVLNIVAGSSVAECEYCGAKQTVPGADSEKKLKLFRRAGRLLRACDFDRAVTAFRGIIAEFPQEAEAYWGLVLCKYGIEYVDDPATGRKIPTCHRSSFDSVLDDENFNHACENADPAARRLYRDEAKAIEELRKRIIEVSGREAPYDIFICYKETDENGGRTPDSVLAQDIYDALTGKGYRVFFSRVTLEDKPGQEYEPYIFAALNSAKVMLAVGTDCGHYNAVWVRNEWIRFLKLIASGQEKTLIPCRKWINACDMPRKLARLPVQDMGKAGAMRDLLCRVDKLMGRRRQAEQMIARLTSGDPSADSLCACGELLLEAREWTEANGYFERALGVEPRMARAHLGKLLAARKAESVEALAAQAREIADETLFQETLRCADEARKAELNGLSAAIQAARQANIRRLKPMIARSAAAQKRIAAGTAHAVGLKSDGTAIAAGANDDGQCDISGETELAAVAAGWRHSVGLKSDGTVVAVGYNTSGQCNVAGWTDIVAISAGASHTIGLKSDGTVVAAGENWYGQCDVTGWTDIVAIAAGENHTAGLKSDGTAVAVGRGKYYQCDVTGWTDIVAIAAGSYHTVGLKADGTVVAVGENWGGGCDVADWTDIVAIAAGNNHTVGLRSDGTVVSSDPHWHGQRSAASWTDIVAISAGDDYTVGLKADGTVVSTIVKKIARSEAFRDYGQSGVSGWRLSAAPESNDDGRRGISGETKLAAIAAGEWHTVGLRSDGTVVATGSNLCGQCSVSGWTDISAIAAGAGHTVGLKADGTVVATPVVESERVRDHGQSEVSGWTDIAAIAAGYAHTVGLKSDGTVVAAGDNKCGRCDVSGWTDIAAIAAGNYHTVGLKSDGTVVAAGSNLCGQCNVTGWTDIAAIAANGATTLGLKSDGTVVAAGSNKYGQRGIAGRTGMAAISAGKYHAAGLKADGTVVAAGSNRYGQCDVSGWTDIAAIAAGAGHTVGLKADGTVAATPIVEEDVNEKNALCGVTDWKLFDGIDTL